MIPRLKIYRQEVIEIYNALRCLNISIKDNQKKRAKKIQKLIKKVIKFKEQIK